MLIPCLSLRQLPLDEAGPSSPTTGSTGTFSRRLQNIRLKIPFRRVTSTPTPKLPSKDTLESSDTSSLSKYQNNEDEDLEDQPQTATTAKSSNNVDRSNSNVHRTESTASDSYQQVRPQHGAKVCPKQLPTHIEKDICEELPMYKHRLSLGVI